MTYLCTTLGQQPRCNTHSVHTLPVRRPLQVFGARSRLHGPDERCHRKSSAGSRTVTASAAQQGSQAISTRLARQQPQFTLSRSQLTNKQIVTRTDGQILGVVEHLLADPNTCTVVALSCKPSPDMLAGDVPKQVSLMSLKQISDVLLVHDQRALLTQPLTVGLGYIKLVGTAVKTADGKVIGKVRDFVFSPDNGQIVSLLIDALGIPAIPQRLLGCLSVRIQLVHNISWNSITLQPGAEAYVDKISPGAFDGAVELLRGYLRFSGWGASEAEESRDDPAYVDWYLTHGQAYEQLNGKKIARPSEVALQSALQARSMQQPQALPPGRQPSYDLQLQPQQQPQYQSQLEYQQAEPELASSYFQQQTLQSPGAPQQQSNAYERQAQLMPNNWSQQPPQQLPDWQQPASPQLRQQRPPSSAQSQSQQQPQRRQHQQQQQAGQQARYWGEAASQLPQGSGFSGSCTNKLEQQRRSAQRAEASVTEPRFDPRRRKTGTPSTSQPQQAKPERADWMYSQPRGDDTMPGRMNYSPQRSSEAPGPQRSDSPPAAQQAGPLSRGTLEQPSSKQANTAQQDSFRHIRRIGNGYQSRNSAPAEQSFQSWAVDSSQPAKPLLLQPDGTFDAA